MIIIVLVVLLLISSTFIFIRNFIFKSKSTFNKSSFQFKSKL
jgi:hypothetical protein